MTKAKILTDEQIHQGDIFKNIDYIERLDTQNGEIDIMLIRFPYVMVLSQECDLKQDFSEREKETPNHDKLIQSIMVVPIFNFEHFSRGEHLANLGYRMSKIFFKGSESALGILKDNNNPRYHYLQFDADIELVPSILDFKRFFTLDAAWMYRLKEENYVCSLDTLYRERVSQRFANFLSRIGLPEDKSQKNSQQE